MRKLLVIGALALAIATARAADTPYEDAMQKSRTAFEEKQFAEAETLARQALALAQTPEERAKALSNVGSYLQGRGQEAEARKLWEQVLSLPDAPDEVVAADHLLIGGSYFNEGNYEAARQAFQQALRAKGAGAEVQLAARLFMAASYGNQKLWSQAAAEYQRIASDAQWPPVARAAAQRQIGAIYSEQEKWEEARAQYVKALGIQGVPIVQRAEAMSQITQTYEKQFGRARALDEVTQFHAPLYREAQRLFDAGQWEPARDYYAALVAVGYLNPSVVWGFQEQIAETYLGEKNWEEARKLLNVILAAQPEPNWPPRERAGLKLVQQLAQSALAQSYQQAGDAARAKAEFEKLLQIPDLNQGLRAKAEAALTALKQPK